MTLILPATAIRARQTQRVHDLQEGGWWCRACVREGEGQIAAGKCDPYTVAEAILVRYATQQVRTRPPARGRATVGVRYWART